MDYLKRPEVWIVGAIAMAAFLFRDTLAQAADAVSDDPSFTQFDGLYKKYAAQTGVPWRWIKAVAMNESRQGQASSVARGLKTPSDIDGSKSSDGKSWGIMQVTLATARELEGQQIQPPYLNSAENSIRLGAKYLAQMISRFGISDRESVIRAYNGGPGFAKTALGQTSTPIYYARFVANLALIQQKQPGPELET